MPGVHGQTYGQVTRSRKARTSSSVHDACANARRALHTRERSRRKISTTRSEQESWQSVRFAQAVFSFPSCDDIMILDAERCVMWKNRCADWRHMDDQFVFCPKLRCCLTKGTKGQISGRWNSKDKSIQPSPTAPTRGRHRRDPAPSFAPIAKLFPAAGAY